MDSKPRSMWIAGIFAFITFGLGHFYSGDIRKAVFIYLGQVIVWACIALLLLIIPNYFVIPALLIYISYMLYSVVDAVLTAKRCSEPYTVKIYNKWYLYIFIFVVSFFYTQPFYASFIRKDVMAEYVIPTESMKPTMIQGDYVIANNFIYKFNKPKRGDLVVFKDPYNSSGNLVKRLIGVSGDIIEIRNKKLYLNNVKQNEKYIVHYDKKNYPSKISSRDNYGPFKVPKNRVFLLGDNRDNSFDSRNWGGVAKDTILGKVQNLYWSRDIKTDKIRWKRIFQGNIK